MQQIHTLSWKTVLIHSVNAQNSHLHAMKYRNTLPLL